MWTTFLSEISSADHLTLVPFESKFISFVAYFNSSTFISYAIWHILLLVYDVQYVTISMCRLGVGKTINNVSGPGGSSGKALSCGLDGPGFDPGCRRGGDFSLLLRVQTGPGVHSPSYKMSTGEFPRG